VFAALVCSILKRTDLVSSATLAELGDQIDSQIFTYRYLSQSLEDVEVAGIDVGYVGLIHR